MEKLKKQYGVQVIEEYTLERSKKGAYAFFAIILIVVFIVITWAGGIGLLLIFIPLVAYLLWFVFVSATQKLVIYKDGIEHHYGSRRNHRIIWDNLVRFERRKNGKTMVHGITTMSAIRDEIEGGVINQQIYRRRDKYFLDLTEIIDFPLKSDGWFHSEIDLDALKETKFGRTLDNYAPHLFEKGK